MKPTAMAGVLLFISFTAIIRSDGQANNSASHLAAFTLENGVPLKIVRTAVPSRPFTVVGPRGAILGQQDGSFEAWIFPWKTFTNLRLSAAMTDYPVPIDRNRQTAVA